MLNLVKYLKIMLCNVYVVYKYYIFLFVSLNIIGWLGG